MNGTKITWKETDMSLILMGRIKKWAKVLLIVVGISVSCSIVQADDVTVFRTGLEADRARIAVSPNGERILFSTNRSGEGMKFSPFFSQDGKTVYYFKGKKREIGKTPASRYDLFSVDLASGQKSQLTHEEFYQASDGDDTTSSVLFSAIPSFDKRFKDALGQESENTLFVWDKTAKNIAPIKVDQSSGIFDFSRPQRDRADNLYFISAKARPGGHYLCYLVRSDKSGNRPELLTELPISMEFDIARKTGEIFVMNKDGKELVILRLSIKAAY